MKATKYLQLAPADTLPELPDLRPFKAVVIVATPVTPDQQNDISHWLVKSGCLYMMAWGEYCIAWAESVQRANREAFTTPEIPDQSLVITTSHEVEALKDVFWYAKHTAIHPCFKLDNILLLDISTTGREQEICTEFAAA
jgi:hypothetical protein